MHLRTALALAFGCGLSACAKPASEQPPQTPAGAASGAAPASGGAPGDVPDVASNTIGTAPGPGGSPSGSVPAAGGAPLSSAPERHGPSLPELSVKSFGLHVGGSAADAAARADFLCTLEAASPSYLDCYRTIDAPGSIGTFGADLTIGGTGGKPRVGKPRTKLRGDAFQSCMVRAFESVSFARTPSGRAVVVSYSVKFNLSQ